MNKKRSTENRLARIEISMLNYNAVSAGHKPPAKSWILLRAGVLEAKRQLLTWTPIESDLTDLERSYGQYYVMDMRAIVRVYAPKDHILYETAKKLRSEGTVTVIGSNNSRIQIVLPEFILAYTVATIGVLSMGVSLVNRFMI